MKLRIGWTAVAVTLGISVIGRSSAGPRIESQAAPHISAEHDNRVSPGARTLLAKYASLVYRPADAGARVVSGTFTIDVDGATPSARFKFEAPRSVKLEWTKEGAAKRHPQSMLGVVDMVLSAAFTGMPVPDEREYDAEVVHDAAGEALDITTFRGEVARLKLHAVFDGNGLVKSVTMTAAAPPSGSDPAARSMTTEIGWEKYGDKYRVNKLRFPGGGIGAPGEMSIRLSYEEFGAVAIPTAWSVDATLGAQSQSLKFRLAELQLDGKPVELPKPTLGAAKQR